ncbi:ABC transporter permease [Paenibacillus gansuensis]|uniref:ABC transporter permease n=1 Tax=Paenibacillus gansuensis TaxID=306542 RepID=A0ABW5PGU6_9BACL
MIGRLLAVEFLKIRRKMIWFLIFLGPLGVVGLQAVNFGLRYDYLVHHEYAADLWGGLLQNVVGLMVPTLFMGLAIIASMTAGIEHQTNAWKQTLALPVSRVQVFTAKFTLSVLLLLASVALTVAGTAVLGIVLGFGFDVPLGAMAAACFYPFVASLPFLALQTWLSVTVNNQAVPLTVGIAGMLVCMFSFRFPDWLPWKWPMLAGEAGHQLFAVSAGAGAGLLLLGAGALHFSRKDVK